MSVTGSQRKLVSKSVVDTKKESTPKRTFLSVDLVAQDGGWIFER